MQDSFIVSAGNNHWRKTHKAEAGRLSLWASRELFLQASVRQWLLERQAGALWVDGGFVPLGTGRSKEEESQHGERRREGQGEEK